jgi:hypothetical protein
MRTEAMITWTPKHSRIFERNANMALCELLDRARNPTVLPPRWYTVELVDEVPDWTTVRYHRLLSAGLRRLGVGSTRWVHPDER